jgi:hypothetical protein
MHVYRRPVYDLPPSCATGPGPIAHPASRSMTSPSPSVTVVIRHAADETTTRDGCAHWPNQARHTSQMDRLFVCEVKSLQCGSACKAFRTRRRDLGRDGLTTTAAAAVAAGRCWSCLSARVDSLSTVTCDQSEHCPIRLRAWADS